MIVENIKLLQFRNYSSCEAALSPGLNVFVGKNAQGKTNLLESLVFISTTRSHRTMEDTDMIRDEQLNARVTVTLLENDYRTELTGMIGREGKHLFVQKQPIRKTSEFIGKLNAVLFSPSDFELFDGSPKIRRRFMDMEIGKTAPGYMQQLNSYQKLLKERNACLKQPQPDDAYIDVLTDQLITLSLKIASQRRQFVSVLNGFVSGNYEAIAEEPLHIEIRYFSVAEEGDGEKQLRAKYQKCYERDRLLHQTSIGIHKDDMTFWINHKEVNAYASQGQKRMIVLAIKTALIGYVRRMNRRDAILLLDDVLSELDDKRRRNLLNLIPSGIQTIITTTSIDDLKPVLPAKTKLFTINDGVITSVNEVIR